MKFTDIGGHFKNKMKVVNRAPLKRLHENLEMSREMKPTPLLPASLCDDDEWIYWVEFNIP